MRRAKQLARHARRASFAWIRGPSSRCRVQRAGLRGVGKPIVRHVPRAHSQTAMRQHASPARPGHSVVEPPPRQRSVLLERSQELHRPYASPVHLDTILMRGSARVFLALLACVARAAQPQPCARREPFLPGILRFAHHAQGDTMRIGVRQTGAFRAPQAQLVWIPRCRFLVSLVTTRMDCQRIVLHALRASIARCLDSRRAGPARQGGNAQQMRLPSLRSASLGLSPYRPLGLALLARMGPSPTRDRRHAPRALQERIVLIDWAHSSVRLVFFRQAIVPIVRDVFRGRCAQPIPPCRSIARQGQPVPILLTNLLNVRSVITPGKGRLIARSAPPACNARCRRYRLLLVQGAPFL
jgi:hypothetical protein